MVCCSCYSDRKPGKPLSDFPHNAIRYDSLRFAIPKYGFSIMECYLHHGFHIKGDSTEQIIPCLLQCCRLNLWDDSGKFLFCDFLRYLLHFCPVLFGTSTVAVLCIAPPNITAVSIFAICSIRTIIDYHLLFSPYPGGGWVLVSLEMCISKTTTPWPHRSVKYIFTLREISVRSHQYPT